MDSRWLTTRALEGDVRFYADFFVDFVELEEGLVGSEGLEPPTSCL